MSDDPVEGREELFLRADLLDDRLDDQIARGKLRHIGHRPEAGQRGVHLGPGHPLLLDVSPEVLLDRGSPALGKSIVDLSPDDVEAGLDAHLCDSGPHRSEADDTDGADLH